jgi:ABC-type dipeptide/oligopeptide/nickel transport system permease subunit
VLPAGLMITLTVLSLALAGFALEQRFEPGVKG